MTLDEYLKAGGTKTELHHATRISLPTIRRVERRLPIRLDVAYRLAEFLGGKRASAAAIKKQAHAYACPAPRRVRKKKTPQVTE